MAPQDMFIDEEDDTCPLCVEEFDLSDKNFRPCPCGYQVCQFCFNNIKNNMNGLCPACRRPYDEKTIEWKVVTPEETQKKKAEQRQKEAQKREVESLNRKHLSGLRVVQKNLVYVTGLNPTSGKDSLLDSLRGPSYFGQYGDVIKVAVTNKTRPTDASNVGVYVTFSTKEEAQRCIAAINNSQNNDRTLRASLGTTKYCSAYLRNETCTNKNCMFLHEPGDNDDSYSRQDLSSINSVNTQRPLPTTASSSRQAPLQHMQPVAAAAQPMHRESSKDGSDSGDGSALPSSASWANKGVQQRSRRGSHATSGATSSPAASQAMPATAEVMEEPAPVEEAVPEPSNPAPVSETESPSPRPHKNQEFAELLLAITSLPSIQTISIPELPFPPLFDTNGGAKRRAMREQNEEEARLNIEQESLSDIRSTAEPLEEEEPESGSLQLGGEPEDSGREIPQGFQRRPSAQLPIQRTNNGPGAPGLVFPRNLSNLSSINGRTLTLQQRDLLLNNQNPSSSFADQFSPGMGGQSNQSTGLFQQQGHNRQSSRFNFSNENPSLPSIKPSANPKLMAQQSSMMPSVNHTQGSQFYGSSMPPPPGLKSAGTPPAGFGQNHGFGGSMGGASAFNRVPKGNESEMLQDIFRGRSNVGAGQSHDTGKREFMFPSFLQQYPSASSTPAPASGLASLYGSQPGAFHDYSQKQKKKGKKHRHANTSSSGGGGLVDLADPSILQARMQHQQQSNAGVGPGGLFGSQAQGSGVNLRLDTGDVKGLLSYLFVQFLGAEMLAGMTKGRIENSIIVFIGTLFHVRYSPRTLAVAAEDPNLDEATSAEVDALVADDTADDYGSYPNVLDASRSSTPSVPPGFLPQHRLSNFHDAPTKIPSRILATSAPFVPPSTTPLASVAIPESFSPAASQAKQELRQLATQKGLTKEIASQSSQPAVQAEEYPALGSEKAKLPLTPTPTPSKINPKPASTTTSKKQPSITPATAQTPSKSDRRATPLSVVVPSKVPTKITTDVPAHAPSGAGFPPLPPSTPSASSTQSPVSRNASKPLRIASTVKSDTPTAGSATPFSITSNFPPQLPSSRQPSLASMSRHERPGTPTSEMISDNASITSTSMSRANSPPPSKIGSAPLKTTTRSARKKQEPKVEEIGPIMGRKRKQKKDRIISSAAGGSTPAASRPPSPSPVDTASTSAEQISKASPIEQTHSQEQQSSIESEIAKPSRGHDAKTKGKAKGRTSASVTNTMPEPVPAPPPAEVEEEGTTIDKPIPTPASVLQELTASGEISDAAQLAILKEKPGTSARSHHDVEIQAQGQKLTITTEDRAALFAGKPVRKNGDGPTRILLTPNGDYVRNLTAEEEDRYLQLQARLAEEAGATAFVSTKHNANNGFTLIGGRAVPNGPPSFFPAPAGTVSPLDPVSKIQRDEALSYINQYVLPSLSTNSQLEKALNANALDAELTRSTDSAGFPSWSTHQHGDANSDAHDQAGILANGLDSMTAHFAVGRDGDSGRPLGNVSLLSLPEAETAMQAARKEAEIIEKKLIALVRKNRRMLLGSGH
ncbi:General negative regulator of transcription subunit [Lachnellula subtilissima]|uniref:General negative regulator of transcription subunit n=1 Tax=Lachnellula subtilissima TaxID=602034 RepID=A0A8H8RPL8_9HELO|nr:General negative regulator of transcription subunit [Lachnellula subtilissima]